MKFVDVANPEREVKLGQRGEICVKGPNVTKGYWKKPEASVNSVTVDGFFRTGDVGYMDETGPSISWTGSRTCCCAAGSTSIRATSKRPSISIRRSRK